MRISLTSLLLLLVASGLASADVIPNGVRRIACDVAIHSSQSFPEYVFYAAYRDGVEKVTIDPENAYVIPAKKVADFVGLYAVPRETVLKRGEEKTVQSVQRGGSGFYGQLEYRRLRGDAVVPIGDFRTVVLRRYRIDRVNEQDGIVVAFVDDGNADRDHDLAAAAAGIALSLAFVFAGLLVARRLRNPKPRMSTESGATEAAG